MNQAPTSPLLSLDRVRGQVPAAVMALSRPLEALLRLDRLNAMYDRAAGSPSARDRHFTDAVLDDLKLVVDVRPEQLQRIPATGPLLIVANHPYGVVEGLIAASILRTVRPDVRIMANHLLGLVPEMREMCIFVDPFDRADSAQKNVRGMKQSLRHLRDGGALVIFPAGEVASLKLRDRRVADPAWSAHVAAMALRSRATVVPMFFPGRNGAMFQLAGVISPHLRTLLLPREMLKRQNTACRVEIGAPIDPETLAAHGDEHAGIRYLRLRTEVLAARDRRERFTALKKLRPASRGPEPIAPAMNSSLYQSDIDALGDGSVLSVTGDLKVHLAHSRQAPHLMHELGRQREITFRAVGEGSGKCVDLDRFDDHYAHLLMWNGASRELVGAYRLGPTDRMLRLERACGRGGLYARTLFEMPEEFFERLGPGLELGRSFIRGEYQRSFSPLLLLWKAIGRYLCLQPRYRKLLGPVSISAAYTPTSRALIGSWLMREEMRSELSELVRPRTPMKLRKREYADAVRLAGMIKDIDELNAVVSDIEPDGKGVPVLVRQYLKLGAKTLGMNVDPAFNNCVDCLVVIDMLEADRRAMAKYMGKEACAEYYALHENANLKG